MMENMLTAEQVREAIEKRFDFRGGWPTLESGLDRNGLLIEVRVVDAPIL